MAAGRKKLLPARTATLLLLAGLFVFGCLASSTGDTLPNENDKTVERIKRDGDVTVLLLDDAGKKKTSPAVGLLSSMARTFVQDGVTTEYATHVIGTTVGDRYAHIVSTGSRVFYDNVKPTNRHDTPEFDLQTILDNIERPVDGVHEKDEQKERKHVDDDDEKEEEAAAAETNLIKGKKLDVVAATVTGPAMVDKSNVSVRQEISVRKGSSAADSIRPAKANAKNGLPTFTVNSNDEEYLPPPPPPPPVEQTTRREDPYLNKLRSSKNLFRNGFKPIEIKKYETVTYFGFADFMTTVGNTVIIFMPKTPTVPEATGVTSIKGEATLRPEDIVINPTKSSATLVLTKTLEPSTTTTTAAAEKVEYNNVIESSVATAEGTMAVPTEPLSRRISETTRVFNNEQEALGLLKTIGGVDVIDSKTTRLTTFFYGTYVNGRYTQLEQTVSTLLSRPSQTAKPSKIETPMTATPRTAAEPRTTTEKRTANDVTTGPEDPAVSTTPDDEIVTTPDDETVSPSSPPSDSTPYKTYTYLTTFFVPVDGSLTTTSVKSRTVLAPETATRSLGETATSTTESMPATGAEDEDARYTTTDETATTTEREADDKDVSEPTTTVPTNEEVTTEKPVIRDSDDKEMTTENTVTGDSDDDDVTTEMAPTTVKPVDDEEVELLFKTFYTTYTYLTTFFQETATSVSSREEVVTNVVVSTVEKDFLATDPAVAGLFDREDGNLLNTALPRASARSPRVLATRVGSGRPSSAFLHKPADDMLFASTPGAIDFNKELATPPLDDGVARTFSKTYTYFTTLLYDGSTDLKSHTEVYTNVVGPSNMPLSQRVRPTAVRNVNEPTVLIKTPETTSEPMDEPESANGETEDGVDEGQTKKPINSEAVIVTPSYKYDMTITRNRTNYNSVDEEKPINSMNDVIGESTVTGTKSISSNNIKRKVSTDDDEDMESSETNEDIEPSPKHELHTSFTTYTYFTTIYKGSSSSQVVSRFETVTNVVPQTVEPTEVDNSDVDESTLPVTFFTTYTYWTTLYKDSNTVVTSRKETVTNVVSPSASSPIVATIQPSSTLKVVATEKPREPEPTTFFTTFTYFTTSYLDNETIVNSRLETVTNVLNTKDTEEYMNNESTGNDDSVIKTTPENIFTERSPSPVLKPTGLISSITTKEVNDGETTSFTTDVYGTYIDGLYAQILESRSNIVQNASPSVELKPNSKSTGIVALNEGKIVDADGVSTTFYTTKAIGTYIDQLYAQVIESTSSLKVNDNRKVSDPPTTVLGSKTYRTGLISLIEGTSVKDASTTYYETRVIGKVVDGKYTQEYESDSSIKIGVRPTAVQDVKASSAQLNEIVHSKLPITPSPAAIESSQGENGSTAGKKDETDEDGTSKKKTFPVIRPFASRPRPTFQPKKKTADSLSAATINRSITPTIVATPALKTNDKGVGPSSRNRFSGANRKSSSSQAPAEIVPSSTNTRKYSRSKSANAPTVSPSIDFKGRTPSSALKIAPTASASSFGGSRRSSPSQRPAGSKASDTAPRSSAPSRFRIRPTVSSGHDRFSSAVTTGAEQIPADNNEVSTAITTDEAPLASDGADEDGVTAPSSATTTTTTTESSRRGNNPLLKLRRPPLPKTAITTQSPRRNAGRTTARTSTTTTTTTPRPQRPKTPSPLITRNRPKPVNGLFPSRGFGKKEQEPETTGEPNGSEEERSQPQEINVDELLDDGGSDGSAVTQVEPQSNAVSETERPSRGSRTFSNQVQIRPFSSRRTRAKRQVEFGNRNENSRSYRSRQPAAKNTAVDYYYYDEYVEQETAAPARTSPPPRRQPVRSRQQQQKVTPTAASSSSSSNSNRSQFTLREKTTAAAPAPVSRTSNFRRTRPETTTSKRPSRPLRYPTTTPEPARNSRRYTPSARRQSSRTRYRDDPNASAGTQSVFDGSITVTHRVPTELTIPVVVGKNTEYKQVLTARPSTEILGPHQYSTVTGKNGLPTVQLARELTETLPNGATEITRFVIHEQPTSSVTFTPTYIRGRKTSYSHVIASTVYEVKPEVNTVQPRLANAPLANLLLSQLLLGNLGIQQTVNPLLAFGSAMATAQSPTTEFKTRSTTYVTRVTESTSTVLPITFRGIVVSTTVVDSSVNVITATEYITETIVTTPTVQPANAQLNTLLLPALLHAQLLGQGSTTANNNNNNLLGSVDSAQDELLQQLLTEPTPEYAVDVSSVDESKPAKKKNVNKKPPDPVVRPAEPSVVTLYVSGKRPGEFSTVLSTVGYDETATVRKREVEPSSVIGLLATDEFEDVLLSSADDERTLRYDDEETQSLESVLGDVGKNVKIENRATRTIVATVGPSSRHARPSTGHFLSNGSADTPVQREVVKSKIWSSTSRTDRDAPGFTSAAFPFGFPKIPEKQLTQTNVLYNAGGDRENSSFTFSDYLQDGNTDVAADRQRGSDERRFNFATKKMSNGVEVIVAGDKSTYPGQASVLRVLPTSQARPVTLAPSTLTDHMLMMLPHPVKQSMHNQFVTKTYLTTYTYLTTFLDGEATVVSSREKVVSNVVTDELNKITPTSTVNQVVLTSSPSLETGVYHTTYTYLNTIVDGDVPLVMTSHKTVANTVTAPHEFLTPLQTSEPAYHNTNTYLNTVAFTKTLTDGPDYTVVSTEDILTQVIITRTDNTPTMDTTKLNEENTMTDVTKTYYVTYTYYNTIQNGDGITVKSDISVSSDVVTERYAVPPTGTDGTIGPTPAVDQLPFNVHATKTYLTTFTYFTTLLKDSDGKNPSGAQVKSRTKIVQNVVTESLDTSMFDADYLSSISMSVRNEKIPITATATLDNGQRIEFTATNAAPPGEHNVTNGTRPTVRPQETQRPAIDGNSYGPSEDPKETVKPSSVSKVPQKTDVQKPPKKNSTPPKSEQKIPAPATAAAVRPGNGNVGGLIDFGTIGNSLTALKPVITAVAGIIQNNLKNDQKTKHANAPHKTTAKPVKQVTTTGRAPIYIPVGGLADSVASESQQYPDTDQRHPHVGPARPPVEASLLSGGIPISPGDVITTNSDVIIGKPSVLGPRPPTENLRKNEIPFGMKPPPPPTPPPTPPHRFNDQISVPNNVVRERIKNPSPHTDRKNVPPNRHHENRVQAQYQLTHAPIKSEVNIVPLSKPEPWPTKFVTDVQPLVLTDPADVQPQVSYGNQHLITSHQPSFLEHSAVDPLLVNIQPSQVAQVVIPHGSQTALIYSDQPAVGHGAKGEIFNDPHPYPENHVNPGFVGLEIYGTLNPTNNVASKIPANAMHFDIPVSPAGITVGDSEPPHHIVVFDNETGELNTGPVHVLKPNTNDDNRHHQQQQQQRLPPPPPVNPYRVRQPDVEFSNDDDDDDDPSKYEDGEVTQESKKTPLRPGELPFGVHVSQTDEDRTPIITGKPLVGKVTGEEQILSIGQPVNGGEQTELKPGVLVVPISKRPAHHDGGTEQTNNNNSVKPHTFVIDVPPKDDIKQAMDMDEKLPPLPTTKHGGNDLDGQGSTPQPSAVKPNRDNDVLGLSPPPVTSQIAAGAHYPDRRDNDTQRPSGFRRPSRPKPPKHPSSSPYPFETPMVQPRPQPAVARIEPVSKPRDAPSENRSSSNVAQSPEIMTAESKVVSQGPNAKTGLPERTVTHAPPTERFTTTAGRVHLVTSTEDKIETAHSTTETPALTASVTTVAAPRPYTTAANGPAGKTADYHSVISVVVKNDGGGGPEEKASDRENAIEHAAPEHKSRVTRPRVTILQLPERPSFMDEFHQQLHQGSSMPTRFVTHTQTMSVTVTETTVLQSDGFEPSTHTLVLTKTQTSTLVDTVTEFHTLVKPTRVLSTITTTVPAAVDGTKTKTATARPDDGETLLVVVTDKKAAAGGHGMPPQPQPQPPLAPEIQVPDETNEIGPSDVLLSGILTHSSDAECRPECRASRNELCQRTENAPPRCVCRPGFARMFVDRPCKPTYTYTMRLVLDRYRKEPIRYSAQLQDPGSGQYQQLTEATREGLNRMSMQSDLRDIYHGVIVGGFGPAGPNERAVVSYVIQLSENADDTRLWEATKKSLRATNYSLGGTDVFAARDQSQLLSAAEDFDECGDSKFHDCSDNAKCFNLHGTYTCSCKDGFTDISHNAQFPGRVCSSELIGCDLCNYHGTCYSNSNQDQTVCECFQWYAGKRCQFNLKVLLLGLIAVGAMLLSLLVACLLMACCKKRSGGSTAGLYRPPRPVIGFRRYRNMIATTTTTRGDKRAMIGVDTGSETSVDRTPPPYVKQVVNVHRQQAHRHVHVRPQTTASPSSHGGSTARSGHEQRDRSLTVMIPRAKYRPNTQQPPPPPPSVLTMSTFGPEQMAVSYADPRRTPTKGSAGRSSRKPSDSTQRSVEALRPPQRKKHAAPATPCAAGALVSAGFEVSATVVKTKELDEAYVNRGGDRPDFNTGRTAAARTVSVARSFDETTVQPPTRCYHPESHYESKSQYSHKTNDEGHTMVERDLGSTYLMPQSKLYKPDNRGGSDTSNFDSL